VRQYVALLSRVFFGLVVLIVVAGCSGDGEDDDGERVVATLRGCNQGEMGRCFFSLSCPTATARFDATISGFDEADPIRALRSCTGPVRVECANSCLDDVTATPGAIVLTPLR
jgi:hypothetical protein